MPRAPRVSIGGYAYHVLNRASARGQLFRDDIEYERFESLLASGVERFGMRVLGYCLMPNHWHLVLWPVDDGDLSRFMQWLTVSHTQRTHAARRTIGQGHVYQGRFKSFLISSDEHLLTVLRYVERNALKAGLVGRAETWRWSSLWHRCHRRRHEGDLRLASSPIDMPRNWVEWVNASQTEAEERALATSVARGRPFGAEDWVQRLASKHGLEQTLRSRGRPKVKDSGAESANGT
ncbi:MAG: transposase [Deltaproteobacteria bacterium]|nr:transposase [Deltaproteobacteria bacterium]